jgi:hypothetical protein
MNIRAIILLGRFIREEIIVRKDTDNEGIITAINM